MYTPSKGIPVSIILYKKEKHLSCFYIYINLKNLKSIEKKIKTYIIRHLNSSSL